MDLSGANTESMLRFHRFHERLNRSLKLQAIGLGFLADEIDAGTPLATIRQKVEIRQALWGGMPDWNAVEGDVEFAVRDVGQAGVARAFSAFDLFVSQLEAELSSWRAFSNEEPENPEEDDDVQAIGGKVDNLYSRLGSSRSRIAGIWAVYRYFRFARDCIVHREGVASAGLVDAAQSPELAPTLERWMAVTGERTVPAIVEVREGDPLAFSHRQAIAASSMLRLVALDLSRVMIAILGERGFVYLVAKRVFLDDAPLAQSEARATMVKTFNHAMADRYRVRDYNHVEALRILRVLNLTKRCIARFAHITGGQSGNAP